MIVKSILICFSSGPKIIYREKTNTSS